jgi:hypothetical protein
MPLLRISRWSPQKLPGHSDFDSSDYGVRS